MYIWNSNSQLWKGYYYCWQCWLFSNSLHSINGTEPQQEQAIQSMHNGLGNDYIVYQSASGQRHLPYIPSTCILVRQKIKGKSVHISSGAQVTDVHMVNSIVHQTGFFVSINWSWTRQEISNHHLLHRYFILNYLYILRINCPCKGTSRLYSTSLYFSNVLVHTLYLLQHT